MDLFAGILGYIFLAAAALSAVVSVVAACVVASLGKKYKDPEMDYLAEYGGEPSESIVETTDAAPESLKIVSDKTQSANAGRAELAEIASPEPALKANAPTEERAVNPQSCASVSSDVREDHRTVADPSMAAQGAAPLEKTKKKKYITLSEENPIRADIYPVEQRQGDWSNYVGEYDDIYYDPVDACYYEGKAPVEIQRMYLPKPAEPVVKKVESPSAPILTKPKAARAPLESPSGFDEAVIYGQYVIGRDGEERYFTLYSNKGEILYESYNYANEQFCRDAVKRFKKHVLAGAFSIEGQAGSYYYVLIRNTSRYEGPSKIARVEAENSIQTLKYFAQTDVIRVK